MRYFFDLVAGTTMVDPRGTFFVDDHAAHREAIARARTHKGGAFTAVVVRDDAGSLVCRVVVER
jgi:hypothetical protein